MKTYNLNDDRSVVVKKQQGQLTVTMKQKDSTEKFIKFTPGRCHVLLVLLVVYLDQELLLLICFFLLFLLFPSSSKKSRFHHFKSDRDEILQRCSLSKYASIDRD